VVEALEAKPRQIELYPLTLVDVDELEHVDSVFLVTALYFKSGLGLKLSWWEFPLPESPEGPKFTADLLTEVDEVREVYQAARDVEVAFVGLNTLPPTVAC
jgi:hypothetical protein